MDGEQPASAGQPSSRPLGSRREALAIRRSAVSDPSTKAQLIEAMTAARAEFETLLRRIPRSKMSEAQAPGEWSVKDIVAHINSYDRFLALALALRGQKPPDLWTEEVPLDEFNQSIYEANRDLPLDEVLRDSQLLAREILEDTQGSTEEYLFTERSVQGYPYTFKPAELLKSESYGHYLDHVPALRAWLEPGQDR